MFVFVVVAVVGLGFVHKGHYPPILAGRREEGWGTRCELNGCETDDFGVGVGVGGGASYANCLPLQ